MPRVETRGSENEEESKQRCQIKKCADLNIIGGKFYDNVKKVVSW